MDARAAILAAALKVLENAGEAPFSTHNVCAIANVTAPTLYHRYGNANGLLSAAITEAFAQFLENLKTPGAGLRVDARARPPLTRIAVGCGLALGNGKMVVGTVDPIGRQCGDAAVR
jgi:AcrR family transcriptional regulator